MKRVGETVTLYANKSWQNSGNFLWTFGHHNPIKAITIVTNGEVTRVNGTRFDNRLHTDVENGSITISNLTINDSGIFNAQFFLETGMHMQMLNLFVSDNTVISIEVLEGENVTLDTGVKELQKDRKVMWTQGPDFVGEPIAQWKNNITSIDESFKGVLLLNPHTGSLTFIRVTKNYAGVYCVKLLWGDDPYILRKFSIKVFEPVPIPHISSAQANITKPLLNDGSCHINCSVRNAPELTLFWYSRGKKINQTSNPDISTNLSLPLVIRNEGIYSCMAANPVSNETIHVNSTEWCPPHATDSSTMRPIIGGTVVAVLIGLVIFISYCYKQIRNQGAENWFNMGNMQQETTSQDTNVSEGRNDAAENQGLLTNN
ncbi:SLAM family member 5-like isoform X2 [Thunnus albacares]|nr:SLAM family member 5-like isoform X2 [Thunnus albacares]